MTYFSTTTPCGSISAATIYDASERVVRHARARKISAAGKLARMIRLLGIGHSDLTAVWAIAQRAYTKVLRIDG